jgi:uncharacterized repeat protein (TIGR03803 family)
MPSSKLARTLLLTTALFSLTMFLGASSAAQFVENVLHTFNNNGTDGYNPSSPLIFDAHGNLYGTTQAGGNNSGGGTVFEMVSHDGEWTEKVLYNFYFDSTPIAGVIMDASGVLYGVTSGGGTDNLGTVFSLTPETGGHWSEAILHSFSGFPDGQHPDGGLIMDSSGNLYGTTADGGTDGVGIVFELSQSGGVWNETVLYSFTDDGIDGQYPEGTLALDSSGNLYGTTLHGGNSGNCDPGCGTVFELTPSGGAWTETIIHNFSTVNDGYWPIGGLAIDAEGNLFGVAPQGASDGVFTSGAVFELTPAGGGVWNESAIYQFENSADGASPEYMTPVFDAAGNLYGTTSAGGANSVGTVFVLLRGAGGTWTEKVLYSFSNDGTDGQSPMNSVVLKGGGHIYGTTFKGGSPCGCGTVFELER